MQIPYLCDSPEGSPKNDVTNWPAVFGSSEHENKLGDGINRSADERPEDVDSPESDGLAVLESGKLLEGGDGKEERDTPDEEARYSQELQQG